MLLQERRLSASKRVESVCKSARREEGLAALSIRRPQFATVAEVAADVPTLPSLSVATAVMETDPLATAVVSHETV